MVPLLAVLLCLSEPSMSDRIVEFARSKVGDRVGDGECTTLAIAALRHAGAKVRRRPEVPWGEEVPALRDAQPGDILQFEGAVFVRNRALENGGLVTTTVTYPHHTAIISRVRKRGPKPILEILHQNVGPDGTDESERRVVQQGVLNFAEKRRGTVKVYRPSEARPDEAERRPVPGRPASAPGLSGDAARPARGAQSTRSGAETRDRNSGGTSSVSQTPFSER